MHYIDLYTTVILHSTLNLQQGEALSINTNRGHQQFAQDLAQQAAEITLHPVQVVLITKGNPADVFTVKPLLHDPLPTDPIRRVLLRIDDTEDREWDVTADPETIIKEPALLQRVGNLGPPQLDRTIAPWSIIAVPGPAWARRLLGEDGTETELHRRLAGVLKTDQQNPLQAWKEQTALLDYRLAQLNRLECESFHITTGTGTDLTVAMVTESRWRGGVRKLQDGRSFMPMLPLDRVSMLADRQVTEGVVVTTRDFQLLGTKVRDARLVFSKGSVVSCTAEQGEHALAVALGVDEGSAKLGECSLVERNQALCSFSNGTGHIGFDENCISSVTLGMGEAIHLEELDTYTDENDLQQQTGCNVSLLRARLPIGDDQLTVTGRTVDGKIVMIMKNGTFCL